MTTRVEKLSRYLDDFYFYKKLLQANHRKYVRKCRYALRQLEKIGVDTFNLERDLKKESTWTTGKYEDFSSGTDYTSKTSKYETQAISK